MSNRLCNLSSLTQLDSAFDLRCAGTIGMTLDEKSGALVPSGSYLAQTLAEMPELHHPDVPSYTLLSWPDPIDSSDFTCREWRTLAEQIEHNYLMYDGFVILHGTDTMAYTASALSFMLENLGKTVILSGSMIPLASPVSDAKRNLIVSMMCSVNLSICEVCVYFNTKLFRGNRCRKMSPGTINAFDSPNMQPLADLGVTVTVRTQLILPPPRRRLTLHTNMFTNISVLSLIPSFEDSIIDCMTGACTVDRPFGLILALYGAGNAPSRKSSFMSALSRALSRGAVLVITSQCLRGHVDLSAYATGHALLSLGLIDGRDMSIEACCTKLSYLMGRGLRGHKLKQAMEANLRGELTLKHDQTYEHSMTSTLIDDNNSSVDLNAHQAMNDRKQTSKIQSKL